jgi:hypothetical protein
MRPAWKTVTWILLAGVVGALVFVLAQHLEGFSTNIAEYIGAQIASRRGWSPATAGPIGWGVHLGVALTYATLFVLLTRMPQFPRRRAPRWGAAVAIALVLGWVTTLVAAPAVPITISLLAGKGLPEMIPRLNASFGPPLWNHLLFFGTCLVVAVLARDIVEGEVRS